jgi:hypothetical protein
VCDLKSTSNIRIESESPTPKLKMTWMLLDMREKLTKMAKIIMKLVFTEKTTKYIDVRRQSGVDLTKFLQTTVIHSVF